MPVDVFGCCETVGPCEALCLLEEVRLNVLLGREVSSYQVGDEKFVIQKPTIEQLDIAINEYRKRCNIANGKPSRSRAHVCFTMGNHECQRCRRAKCGCR